MKSKKQGPKKQGIEDIFDIKNHTADAIENVHNLTFIAFESLVYIILDRIVFSRILPDTVWSEILRAIIIAFGYIFLYKIVKKIYSKCIIKKHPIFNIDGDKWYHVHIPNSIGENQVIESLSAGTTSISRNLNDFTFKASNYRYAVKDGNVVKIREEATTTWCTETSEICDSNENHIIEVYRASSDGYMTTEIHNCPVCNRTFTRPKTIEETQQFRYGIHLYRIINENKIICTYSDCWPSLKSGKLYLYRNKEERDRKIKRFFELQQRT